MITIIIIVLLCSRHNIRVACAWRHGNGNYHNNNTRHDGNNLCTCRRVSVCVCARLYTRLVWSHGRDESLSAKSSSEFVCDQEPISKTRKPAMMYQYIIITRRFPSVCAPHNGAWAQRDALVVRKNYVRWRLRFSDKNSSIRRTWRLSRRYTVRRLCRILRTRCDDGLCARDSGPLDEIFLKSNTESVITCQICQDCCCCRRVCGQRFFTVEYQDSRGRLRNDSNNLHNNIRTFVETWCIIIIIINYTRSSITTCTTAFGSTFSEDLQHPVL